MKVTQARLKQLFRRVLKAEEQLMMIHLELEQLIGDKMWVPPQSMLDAVWAASQAHAAADAYDQELAK